MRKNKSHFMNKPEETAGTAPGTRNPGRPTLTGSLGKQGRGRKRAGDARGIFITELLHV